MTETAIIATADLDRLTERVEKAVALIQALREKTAKLEAERARFEHRLGETEGRLQGQDVPALLSEVAALRKEQREWQAERREVGNRIEALARKLERIEL